MLYLGYKLLVTKEIINVKTRRCQDALSQKVLSRVMYIGDAFLIKQLVCLNKGSTSRANMGTSVIYFCRLVLMAYSEPRFTTRMMLTTKKSEGMIVL